MKKISVLIVDDHRLIRETRQALPGTVENIDIIGSCGDGQTAIDIVKRRFDPVSKSCTSGCHRKRRNGYRTIPGSNRDLAGSLPRQIKMERAQDAKLKELLG